MNKFFQWFWYNIAKRFTKRKTSKDTGIFLDDYSGRFFSQLSWAENFGDVDLVIFGDSNGEELSDYESMKRFPKLSVNFAIGGTRADHWSDFFQFSKYGRDLYELIKDKKILINVGGNNVLQDQMFLLPTALSAISNLFPKAYWINIPSIYGKLISEISGRSLPTIYKDLKDANKLIEAVAGDRLIDIRNFTGIDEVTPYFYVLKDAVHYSDIFDERIRIPLVIEKVYGRRI